MADNEFFEIEECRVTALELIVPGNKDPLTLMRSVHQITIAQSIDAQYMTGKISLQDTKDIPAAFSLSGNELLLMTIELPVVGRNDFLKFDRTFRVLSIQGRGTESGTSTTNYVISFCSQEAYTSLTKRISKGYINAVISDVVVDVLVNFLGVNEKTIGPIDPTAGVYDIAPAEWRPFEFLQWLSSRAYNVGRYGYHLYETKEGYTFKSLQTMFNSIADQNEFTYDVKAISEGDGKNSDKARNRYSFNSFKIIRDFDSVRSVASGAYSTTLLSVDIRNQTYKYTNYNAETAVGLTLNEHISTKNRDFTRSLQSNQCVYPVTQDGVNEAGNQIEFWLCPARVHKNLLQGLVIKASLPGRIDLIPGTSLFFKMPTFDTPTEKGKAADGMRSGKYLIRDVMHIITNHNNGTFKYRTNLVLCSDSYSEELPTDTGISKLVKR